MVVVIMIDLTSSEEAIKHMQHIKATVYCDIDEPLKFYKSDYKLECNYLGNTIYMLNTRALDMTLDQFCKENAEQKDINRLENWIRHEISNKEYSYHYIAALNVVLDKIKEIRNGK